VIHTSIVIVASGGSRALVRCADSAARQTVSPADIHVATAAGTVPRTIVTSIDRRGGASCVEGADRWEAANAAVARARGDAIAVVPAAFLLERRMVERCGGALAKGDTAAAAPDLAIVTAEGRLVREVRFDARLHRAIADPHTVPPVVVFSRALWKDIGPLDPSFGDRAAYEWWVRLLSSGCRVSVIEEALVRFEAAGDTWWPPVQDGERSLEAYHRILQKHRAAVERDMDAVLIEREVAFGRLLDRHRDLTRRRDSDLVELDRLRAETAHHRAYLSHHGRDAFDWGDWRRPDPISRDWGYDRGEPIDRHYIEAFLSAHSSDVRGSVLEVQEDELTSRFGGPRVERRAVLDVDDGNPRATVVTDLRAADLPDCAFDCIILTQTLHVIDDMTAALSECERLLRPGGVLLATLPCASRVCLEYGTEGDLWRVTPDGARALVEPVFGAAHVQCTTYGSVLTNVAFLHGLARGELTRAEFSATDPYHPVLVGVRARKPIERRRAVSSRPAGVVLLYHRIQDEEDVYGLNVPASLFEAQLAMLAAECCPMPLDRLLSGARDGLPERAVAVTFDDGYVDTLEVAAPLLERFGVPATVFATTRWLDRAGEYWWDALERILLSPSAPT
jgi:SAM-dependent methyltransferase